MSASPKKRRQSQRRRLVRRLEREPLDATWERIGTPHGRRSGWMRAIFERDQLERVELRAGREGDDASVVIDRSNPQLNEIYEVLSCMRFAVEHEGLHRNRR
jgi:hypothetical protein